MKLKKRSSNLPLSLKGKTISHGKNGRDLGYPTANITVDTDIKDGIYVGYASLGEHKRKPALIFVGKPVTLGDDKRRVEAHLLDIPDENYYANDLNLKIVEFIRSNQRFSTLDALKKAMKSDEAVAREWFKTHALAKQPESAHTN